MRAMVLHISGQLLQREERPIRLLWGERSLRSVANLTREDGTAFFAELQHTPVHCDVTRFALDDANQALACVRAGQFNGAIVLTP